MNSTLIITVQADETDTLTLENAPNKLLLSKVNNAILNLAAQDTSWHSEKTVRIKDFH
jgi:hypothetical protein